MIRLTLVEATYDALTVKMTAFMRFLAAVIRDVALSNYKDKRQSEHKKLSKRFQKRLFSRNKKIPK